MPTTEPLLPFDFSPPALLLAGAGLLLAQWPLRWLIRRAFGPLFVAETVRLARRGSTTWTRVGYATALLLTLYASFPSYAYADKDDIAKFARDFSELFLLIQSVAVLLLAPVWFGSAVGDEKDNRSLDFLLTTHLSSREIVLGKYAARVLALGGLLLSGLPVLALTMFWGGVDLIRLLAVFAVTFLSLLSVGAMSLLCSVLARRTVAAVAWSYALMLAVNVCGIGSLTGTILSPVLYQFHLAAAEGDSSSPVGARPFDNLARSAEVHGALTLILLTVSIWQLRRRAAPEPPAYPRMRGVTPVDYDLVPLVAATIPLTDWQPIGANAVVWKERYVGRATEPFFESLWLYFVVFLGAAAVPAFFSGMPQLTDILRDLFFGLATLLTAGWCVGLLLHMAGSISRERERRTLESLLALPDSRAGILRAKCLGSFLRRIRWAIALAGVVLLSLLSGTFTVPAALMTAALAAAQATFAMALGLMASMLAGSTVRAQLAAVVAAVGLVAATSLAPSAAAPDEPRLEVREALSPLRAWTMIERLNHSRGRTAAYLAASLGVSIGVYLAASAAMAALTLWRFRRLERYA